MWPASARSRRWCSGRGCEAASASAALIRLAAMRRLATLLGVSLLLAGCGSRGTVLPTAKEVVGTVPKATPAAAPAGNAKAGGTLFKSQGCGGCHTFKPAGATKTIGPDLDKLAQYAKKANQGSLADFTRESIQHPS